ncbi:MAG: N(2)-acetyl-L-2,4-diaminobutanoate deacetylase DoeB [Alphaproteobacteria bacterium]|nr:N(2)-acetyl-L-2,4-diaminobutanoate deacetylase DoeB [Alphaproteobacteria bacterium]
MKDSPIQPTIPFDRDGAHHGFLRLPHSRDTSAWGNLMIPITVIRNGDGPTALLTGANHGDEYEGPVALQNLAVELAPEDISGRVIIVPYMNYPAFRAGKRTSPIDGGNMNRIFPGAPDGGITAKIADYFERYLVPMADVVMDYHSGGRTLDFVPFAACHRLPDPGHEARCVAAMRAFNAPYSMTMLEIDNVGMYDTAVENQGKVFVTTELSGGGTVTAKTAGIALKGARNLLIHAGILNAAPEVGATVNLDMPDGDCFTFAEDNGMIEPLVDLGEPVQKGQVILKLWPLDRSGVPPIEVTARRSGILAARHFPGLAEMGDCLAVIGVTED